MKVLVGSNRLWHLHSRSVITRERQPTVMVAGPRLSDKVHAGSPSAVMNEETCSPPESDIMTSGNRPKVPRLSTCWPRRRAKLGAQSSSSLQLPHRMECSSSIRQLHSIIRAISPCGSLGLPSRRVRGVKLPSSTNGAIRSHARHGQRAQREQRRQVSYRVFHSFDDGRSLTVCKPPIVASFRIYEFTA